ncbi:MAG: 3-isopropylmalate dehydratase small subunit [Candidatus Omnitrophica bacterium]|nr:3-isopropylmalate dehydratase small subunit [Candidatus Omnitrophota bacterium]MDD5654961.1 3-isopropylmalate dehydratase small subunit [Candidatus Omnitrophota bacterium]
MVIKGKVHIFGDDINTDDIIAAKYLVTTDDKELGRRCMENIAPDFVSRVAPGDIIVAGKNFGCGSSREHAPRALRGCGISAVIAVSFARIFFRNAINVGMPFLETNDARKIGEGDSLEIDLSSGIIKNLTKNEVYKTEPFPEFLREIVGKGGLMNYIRNRHV